MQWLLSPRLKLLVEAHTTAELSASEQVKRHVGGHNHYSIPNSELEMSRKTYAAVRTMHSDYYRVA